MPPLNSGVKLGIMPQTALVFKRRMKLIQIPPYLFVMEVVGEHIVQQLNEFVSYRNRG